MPVEEGSHPKSTIAEIDELKTPSKIKWDLTHGPLSNLLELLDTQVFSGSVQWVLLEISWKNCSNLLHKAR